MELKTVIVYRSKHHGNTPRCPRTPSPHAPPQAIRYDYPHAPHIERPLMELKTVIVYRSKHHGNTKKLVDALVAAHPDQAIRYDYPHAPHIERPLMELKTVIVYRSKHHGNTKKLVDALVAAHPDIDVVDVADLDKNEYPDLSPYHLIVMGSGIYYGNMDKDLLRVADHCLRDGDKVVGIMTVMGSGIYYGNMDKDLLRVADHCLRDGDKVVGIMTYGGQAKFNGRDLDGVCRAKFATLLCMYGCPGYDTYGPFKLVGGQVQRPRPRRRLPRQIRHPAVHVRMPRL